MMKVFITKSLITPTISFLLFVSSFMLYMPSLNYDFLSWDTQLYVIDAQLIRSLAWENLWRMLTSFEVANWHPLTWFSYALDYKFYGLNPWGFHLTNTLLHSANTVLFFIFSIKLLELHQVAKPTRYIHPLWIATLAAFWFGIHPQHIESVVWIAERKDVLSFFFSILALLQYLRYTRTQHFFDYMVTGLWFILACMSKAMAVTLPMLFLILDIYPLQRLSLKKGQFWSCFIEKMPFFLGSIGVAWLTVLAQQQATAVASFEKFSLTLRLVNACNSLILYLSKFLFPLSLSPYYPLEKDLLSQPTAFVAIGAVGIIFGLCFYAAYKRQWMWVCLWLFYTISLLPVLGVVQVGSQAAADRYAYITTLPFYWIVATMLQFLWQNPNGRLFYMSMIFTISVGLGAQTLKQSEIWRNDVLFWTAVSHFSPNLISAKLQLGSAYLKQKNYAQALRAYQQAAVLQPKNMLNMVHYNMALCHIGLGNLHAALELFNALIENNVPLQDISLETLYYRVGYIYFQQHQFEAARQALDTVLRLDPEAEPARILLRQIPMVKP